LAGLTASAAPVLPRTGAFWGLLRSWNGVTPHSVGVSKIEPGSPAETIGLQDFDLIAVVNGQTFSTAEQFDALIRQIPSESPVELKIERRSGELVRMLKEGKITFDLNNPEEFKALQKSLTLRGTSAAPEIEAVMYYDWQFAAAAIFVAVGIFVAATVRSRAAWWRPATVIVVALAGMVLIPLLIGPLASTLVWRRWLVNDWPRAWIPLIACPSFGLAALFLALFELRALSTRQ
jgi:hypothetical protein